MKNYGLSFALIFAANFLSSFGQKCPSEGIAYLPIEDCTKYKLCINGMSSVVECPGGLYFNPDLNNCDLPPNVPECFEGRRNVLTQCGQTLNAYAGIIEYKLNETYEAGELCVFILRHNYSSNPGFRFVLKSHGISDLDENSIMIWSLAPNRYPDEGFEYRQNYLGPPNLVPVLNVEGITVAVVFKPYSNSGTGFKLRFKATGDPEPTPKYNAGFDFVFNESIDSPKSLSSQASCFAPKCEDVFVVTDNRKYITDPSLQFNFTLALNEMPVGSNMTCFDIYSFEHEYVRRVSSATSRCWTTGGTSEIGFKTRGIFIGVFTSFPGNPALANIYWEETADPEHI